MTDLPEHWFCRLMLAAVMPDVRAALAEEPETIAGARVGLDGDTQAFRMPDGFVWIAMPACCAWKTRAMGWRRYLQFRALGALTEAPARGPFSMAEVDTMIAKARDKQED